YNGLTEAAVLGMCRLVSAADVIVPNYTEACFLAGLPYSAEPQSREAVRALIGKLLELGTASAVITSLPLEGRKHVCGYDSEQKEFFFLPYEEIPGSFPGTGDVFSAVMIGRHLNGCPLKDAVQTAMTAVEKMITQNLDTGRKYIPVESFLGLLPAPADTPQGNG
ncbi:MAG: bifunctional hydroxymethylpyrimidine kinase/phosphomethylpyrimidine kinase, partial [Oscillospiraceae bacterium]|nr:bifunctional hydroxymethylpyrimidine kinase/phosphomethylpyrimidine kinase [Oscillospiraceae bacterium]